MNRYPTMKRIPILLIALSMISTVAAIAAAQPPNVVLILSDDQAWMDYGFMGHPEIQTPNLDKLAEASLRFDRGYVAAPICRPSLASIVTGRYPFQHGVTGNDVDGKNERAERDVPLRDAFHQHPSFIRLLTSKGYLAFQSGKWWEGSWQDGGFTGGMTHGDPQRRGRHGDAGLTIGRQGMAPITDFIDHAIEEEQPFLLWYAPFLPHTPHNPPERLLKQYTRPGLPMAVAKYYAMCAWFDETCGELLDYLDETGVTENTLVLYICDNGWAASVTNAEDPNQAFWNNYALRSKGSPYELGIRTPILISWPGRVAPAHSPDLAHAIDLFPTIAAATGIAAPASLEGINLLDPSARKARTAVFGVCHSTHNMDLTHPDSTLQYLWCIDGDWKLLVRYDGVDSTHYQQLHVWDTQPVKLFNLAEDPYEENEVSAQYPDKVESLRRKIKAWHTPSLAGSH
jgi:arylsulfatase A-like enzyme